VEGRGTCKEEFGGIVGKLLGGLLIEVGGMEIMGVIVEVMKS